VPLLLRAWAAEGRPHQRIEHLFQPGEPWIAAVEILPDIMKRVGLEQADYSHPRESYAEMASLAPKFAGTAGAGRMDSPFI
jgi:predicted molibdopterin-dependent oxidoreductase YjgC